jgi:hypothetical protein
MKKKGIAVFIFWFFCCSIDVAFGKVIPGRWEKVDSLTPGKGIVVRLTGGDKFEGDFISSNAESLTIRDDSGQNRELPKNGIKKIQTREKASRGNLLDGTLIGAAIGAATMGIAIAASGIDNKEGAGGAIALSAGIGAGIGLAVDAAVGARETLYEAPKQ